MKTLPTISALLVLITLAIAAIPGLVSRAAARNQSSAPTNAQIEDFQRQIRSMQDQLDELGKAADQATRQRLMQQNWQSMLDYMRQMQSMPWIRGNPDAMGPGMMGRGMMGWRHGRDWMSGCPIVGGPGGGWQLPPNIAADQYRSEMLRNMQRMREQLAEISSFQDPTVREQLLEQHWRDMYRNMQTMRGMGWMWGGPGPGGQAAASLPDADSPGAKLVSQYCTQCHARPSPQLHTATEWKTVISRMKQNMKNFRKANWRGVKIPSDTEFTSIVDYMQAHAR